MDYSINFPNLGIHLEHVGKNIMVGNFSLAYYGMVIAVGMMLGMKACTMRAKETGHSEDDYVDMVIVGLICGVIGARIYYVIFAWDYYKNDILSVFNIRQGGLAIYGGIIGAVLSLYVTSRIKKIPFLKVLDTIAIGIPIGQIIGRWGNFFNREAFGGYTNNLLAMQLPVSAVRQNEITEEMWQHAVTINGVQYIQVHPTFLYEGLWNCGVLVILFLMRKKTKSPGELFMLYIALYGLGRFWIESLRTDQLLIPGTAIPVSMVVSAVGVIGAVIFIIYGRKRAKSVSGI